MAPTADITSQPTADATVKAPTLSAPVQPAVSDPAAPPTVETSLAPLDDAAGVAAGVDTAPFLRTEHKAATVLQSLPHGLGQRLAETVARFPDRPVEVTLSPEELGRVRMSLSTHDGALTMSVQADRPETLDLLRRNIDQLAQDFRDLGFQDLHFSFGERRDGQSPEPAPDDGGAETASEAPQDFRPSQQPGPTAIPADGGLDLRL